MLFRTCLVISWTLTSSLLSFAQVDRFRTITVRVDGSVEFVIRDPIGRRSGFDPMLKLRYDEINASYGVFSIDSEDENIEPPSSVNEFSTDVPSNGAYLLSLYGSKLSKFRLSIILERTLKEGADFIFRGVIDSGATLQYRFEYTSTPNAPFIAKKIVEGSTLMQDLDIGFKMGLFKNRGIYTSLRQKAENAIHQHQRGQNKAAVNTLQAFLNEVNAQTEKGLDKDVAAILTEDAEALIQQWQK